MGLESPPKQLLQGLHSVNEIPVYKQEDALMTYQHLCMGAILSGREMLRKGSLLRGTNFYLLLSVAKELVPMI